MSFRMWQLFLLTVLQCSGSFAVDTEDQIIVSVTIPFDGFTEDTATAQDLMQFKFRVENKKNDGTQDPEASVSQQHGNAESPYDIMIEGAPVECQNMVQTQCMTEATYDDITQQISTMMEALENSGDCTAEGCPRADFAGCVLRMAGHDFMDFQWDPEGSSNPTGGSDGCISFQDPDNAGLAPCLTGHYYRHENLDGAALRPVYQSVCQSVSLADFFVIAAEAVMSFTRQRAVPGVDPGFKANFKYGRQTSTSCEFAAGRMPNPEHGCGATENVFLNALLLDWRGAAALMGVHTLGRVHIGNSGYHGWWSDPVSSSLFNNNYYVSMLAKPWKPREVYRNADGVTRAAEGAETGKFQWDLHERMCTGPGCDTAYLADSNEMMLNTDICLLYQDQRADQALNRFGAEGCCQWAMPNEFLEVYYDQNNQWCSASRNHLVSPRFEFDKVHQACCTGDVTCDFADSPGGHAKTSIGDFAANDTLWFETFKTTWNYVTEVHMPDGSNTGTFYPTMRATVLQNLQASCGDSNGGIADPQFDLGTPAAWAAERAAREAAERAAATADYDQAMEYFTDEVMEKWYVGNSMDNCAYTCARNGKKCSKRLFDESLHETNTYGKVSALFQRIMEVGKTANGGFAGDWYRIADMTQESVAVYNQMNTKGDVTDAVEDRPDGNTIIAGGGVSPEEVAYWTAACRDHGYGDSCTHYWSGGLRYYCGNDFYPNSSCWYWGEYQGQGGFYPNVMHGREHVWRAQGDYAGMYQNLTCLRDVLPGTSGDFVQAFFPAIFVSDVSGQEPPEMGACGANDFEPEDPYGVPDDYCDTAYFDPRWRRACPCEEPEQPMCSVEESDTTACMHEGVPDPECCSRAISASCTEGHVYFSGSPCKWRTHEQWTTTICCPQADATTTTTTLPAVAEGWYLSPIGEYNCSRVCAEEQSWVGQVTKPAGMYCTLGDQYRGEMENIEEVVSAIRWRDWAGASNERNPSRCESTDAGYTFASFPPSVDRHGACRPNWHFSPWSNRVDNVCDPDPASWTTANGFHPSAENWASNNLNDPVRRLCRCSTEPLSTTSTTTTVTTVAPGFDFDAPLPSYAEGWYLGRSGEMSCTNVCSQEQTFNGVVTKPAGYTCDMEQSQFGSIDNIEGIVDVISARDQQDSEQTPLSCNGVSTNGGFASFGPAIGGYGSTTQCYSYWRWSVWGQQPDACDPISNGWTSEAGYSSAATNWLSNNQWGFDTKRRLCHCAAPEAQIPTYAENWYLGPSGEMNCGSVCSDRGLTCEMEQSSFGHIENMTEIIDAIAVRDQQDSEEQLLSCSDVENNGGFASMGPAIGGFGDTTRCYSYWRWSVWGVQPDACNPNPDGWTVANEYNQAAEDWVNNNRRGFETKRRLCRCV